MSKYIQTTLKAEKTHIEKEILNDLRTRMTKEQMRGNDVAQLKGASAWLTSLPLEEGFVLNKREFFDDLAPRYRCLLSRLPQYCACGKNFVMDHATSCMKGGYVHRRHDRIRDLFARAMDDVFKGVGIEPSFQPLTPNRRDSPPKCKQRRCCSFVCRGNRLMDRPQNICFM